LSLEKAMPNATKNGSDGSDLGHRTMVRKLPGSKLSMHMSSKINKSGEKMTNIVKEYSLRSFCKNLFIVFGPMITM
jgi:hypothetical protein